MDTSKWLDARRRELTPPDYELRAVQTAVDTIGAALRGDLRVAEVHPCGSAAKGTMLRGRQEADIVLIMRDAPTPQILEIVRSTIAAAPGVQEARILYKAVCVSFNSGVSVDVLPAARYGVTEDGGSIPRKHRRALDGLAHVGWFRSEGQKYGAHDVVRLVKNWRDVHGLSGVLSSFGLEVLTVNTLATTTGNLTQRFSSVLSQLAQGHIEVQDPARPTEWINSTLDGSQTARVRNAAKASLVHLEQGEPSRAFAGPTYPGRLDGIAGTPLA